MDSPPVKPPRGVKYSKETVISSANSFEKWYKMFIVVRCFSVNSWWDKELRDLCEICVYFCGWSCFLLWAADFFFA